MIESLESRELLASDLVGVLEINEFMAANSDSLTTRIRALATESFGGEVLSPDWIEIANRSSEAVSLDGVYLSDSLSLWNKWQFPNDTHIPPNGYLVVFASGLDIRSPQLDEQSVLHTNFKLAADGEPLVLRDTDGQIIQEIEAPLAQIQDVSYGVDSSGNWGYLRTATPGSGNSAGYAAGVAAVVASAQRGFYDSPFTVELSSTTPGVQIRYTVDGSEPTASHGQIYGSPITINTTTNLRYAAFGDNVLSSPVETQTYLFVADVLQQPYNVPGFPNGTSTWAGGSVWVPQDQQMDPEIVNSTTYAELMDDALLAIPTLSITSEQATIFGDSGWYDGEDVESPISIEVLYPNNATANQQAYAGIQSHSHDRIKRSLRLSFKSEFGESTFKTDLFQSAYSQIDKVNSIVLRGGNNRSWARVFNPARTTYTIDEFSRTSQLAMSGYGMPGSFVHLYINGVYWGLYNPVARADADWNARQFGGADDDWYVFNHGGALSGDSSRVNYLSNSLLDKDMSQTANYQELQQYVDVQAFADYIILAKYTSLADWPDNNYYGSLKNAGQDGQTQPLRFFSWDSEWSWGERSASGGHAFVQEELRASAAPATTLITSIWQSVRQSPEFMTLFADRVHSHLSDGGALSNEVALQRWQSINSTIYDAVIAESARWGDALESIGQPTRTRDSDWQRQFDRIAEFISNNDQHLLAAVRTEGFYPLLDAPQYSAPSGTLQQPLQIANPNQQGVVYYTVDGSDPRAVGGAVSATARVSQGNAIELSAGNTLVRSRVLLGGVWSAVTESNFVAAEPVDLAITELMYHPSEPTANEIAAGFGDVDLFEFIEIQNRGANTLSLKDFAFTSGIEFVFPDATLAPGSFAVIANDQAAFEFRYGPNSSLMGEFSSGKLDNGGEQLHLSDPLGRTVVALEYDDRSLWPQAADGYGTSLVLANAASSMTDRIDQHDQWRNSREFGGSPGTAGMTSSPVFVSGLLADGENSYLELTNASNSAISLDGWFVSDMAGDWERFSVKANTTISPQSSLRLDASQLLPGGWTVANGDGQLWLTTATNGQRQLMDHVQFSDTLADTPLLRLPSTTGQMTPQRGITTSTQGFSVHISEVQFHPAEPTPEIKNIYPLASASDFEFLRITNNGDSVVDLTGWQINGEVDFTFPANTQLLAGQAVLVAATPQLLAEWRQAFLETYQLPDDTLLIGGWSGAMHDAEGRLELSMPVVEAEQGTSLVTVDTVIYDHRWFPAANGQGQFLQRLQPAAIGTTSESWIATDSMAVTQEPERIRGDLVRTVHEDESADMVGHVFVDGSPEMLFEPIAPTVGCYGTFQLSSNGEWTYSLNSNTTQYLQDQEVTTDEFVIRTQSQRGIANIVIQINGRNDAATFTGVFAAETDEDATEPVTGQIVVHDMDHDQSWLVPDSLQGDLGSFEINIGGEWSYSLNSSAQSLQAGDVRTETFDVSSVDGTSARIVITVQGRDETTIGDHGKHILFVSDTATPQGYETDVVHHLENAGHTVTVISDEAITMGATSTSDLVYISESVSSGRIGSKLTLATVPIIVSESWLFDDLHLTGTVPDVDFGIVTSANHVNITSLSHPIVSGLEFAEFDLYATPGNVGWGQPLASSIISTLSDTNRPVVFAYASGATLYDGSPAPAARISLPIWNSPSTTTLQLLDNAIDWATSDIPHVPAAEIFITETNNQSLVSENGQTDSISLRLSRQPTSPVTISFGANSQVIATPSSVTFDANNWNRELSVTLGAVNDSLIEGTHSQLLAVHVSSDDADFQQLQIPAIPVQIHDNDFLPPAEIFITETNNQSLVSEDGQTDSISLRLSRQPSSPVTISFGANSQVIATPSSVTFDANNWNRELSVTLGAVNDSLIEGTHSQLLAVHVSSDDADFQRRRFGHSRADSRQ
ncbi:MAG: lamin tail domain-containing protein [Pirellulaceae bacterium]